MQAIRLLCKRLSAFGGVLLVPVLCLASDVRVVAVTPGRNATVVIEGSAPITVGVGETVEGVKRLRTDQSGAVQSVDGITKVRLLRADQGGAVLSIDGVTRALPLVAASAPVIDAKGNATVTLSADAHGQFVTNGAVNGRSIRFLVDTGADLTALTRADARRIGIHYRDGMLRRSITPNGVGKGWRVSLDSVRVGGVTVRNVDAIVLDNDTLPYGLLGMSFLGRFDMQKQGSTLVLRRRR